MASTNTDPNSSRPTILQQYLVCLQSDPNTLRGLLRGVEKESLRVLPDGSLSLDPHPSALGSALTHESITTDFSEAQLELITGVHDSAAKCLQELVDVHRFVYTHMAGELLWPSSMPCVVGEDADIPVGQYGSSNIGMAKTVYRRGLGLRYGRLMQTISGIHYNFSLPDELWQTLGIQTSDEKTAAYFGLIRNFRRWSWLLIYLFGASPAVCRSFTRNMQHTLKSFDAGSQHLPFATSLRMGPLGYQSSAQSELHISYNSLDEYADSMVAALTQKYPAYSAHGIKKNGEYQQLNDCILQIENEFYGTIRPKRRTESGERPVAALRERGVEYVEVRCLDLNPFLPAGLDEAQMHFLDTFLLLCLLSNSPPDSMDEIQRVSANQLSMVEAGRDPATRLLDDSGRLVSPVDWGTQLIQSCADVAKLLDTNESASPYLDSCGVQQTKLDNPALTPSAQILEAMRTQDIPFFRFSMNQGLAHEAHFAQHPLSPNELAQCSEQVARSKRKQKEIEAADDCDFDTFLTEYLKIPGPPAAPV